MPTATASRSTAAPVAWLAPDIEGAAEASLSRYAPRRECAPLPRRFLLLRPLFLALLLGGNAHAFGSFGHQLIADLAQARLTPEAAGRVDGLLALEGITHLRDISTWADVVRDDPRFKRTAPLHYVNFPRKQCTFVMPRDCANGVCVIGGIAAFSRVLKDPRSSKFERLIALKWLVHLVGDLHQPMHVGYADDRGGAASATGHGESIIKVVLTKFASDLVRAGATAQAAAAAALEELARVQGQGGIIVLDPRGGLGHAFNTDRMARAWVDGNGTEGVGFA